MSDDATSGSSGSFDRRDLVRRITLGALAAGLSTSSAPADEPINQPAAQAADLSDERTQQETSLAALPVAGLIAEAIRREAPDRLTPDVLAHITRDVAGALNRSRVLSAVPLANGDEPATTFQAYRGPELPKL